MDRRVKKSNEILEQLKNYFEPNTGLSSNQVQRQNFWSIWLWPIDLWICASVKRSDQLQTTNQEDGGNLIRKQTPDILSGLMGQSDAVSACWYTS